jgi:hypothetical protein
MPVSHQILNEWLARAHYLYSPRFFINYFISGYLRMKRVVPGMVGAQSVSG